MTKLYLKRLLICLVISLGTSQMSGQLIINEFMQSNIDYIMDDFNDYPDSWLELYNPTNSVVNLSEFSIGIKDKAKKAYSLPSVEIASKGHVLIYCDKEGKGLHTDFRLESGKGGAIYLFKNGEVVDNLVDIKKMPAPNIAFGREEDGSEKWGYQLISTPGSSNMGGVANDILPEPLFSVKGAVLSSPTELMVNLPEGVPEGSVIRFTTDCSEPNTESPEFVEPLLIDTTTIVRAKIFCEGILSPRATTQSYIFHHAKMTIPIVSIVTDSANFYDEKIGILADGPADAPQQNWLYEWRRPINIEFFTSPENEASINQLCETRLKGSKSRYYNVKSMVLYANKRFGEKRLEAEFFPSQRPGIVDFKSLELRNAGQDYDRMYMRDALVQRTMGEHVDIDWQAYQPVVVYLNGHYHALLNLRERANEDNIYTHYDGLEDIDMIENLAEVKAGSIDNFNKFKNFYFEDNHTFQEYCEWMDMDEFINSFIMQIYFANIDFMGNNNVMWRPLEENGKWRWICKDLDMSLGFATHYDFDYFDFIFNPEKYPTCNWAVNDNTARMFRSLLELPEFIEEFTSKFALYMGDFMNSNRIVEQLNEMASLIETEYAFNDAKNIHNKNTFEHHLTKTREDILNRNEFMYRNLAEHFGLGQPIPVIIECENPAVNAITLNGFKLSADKFEGALFADTKLNLQIDKEDDSAPCFIHVIASELNDDNGDKTDSFVTEGELNLNVPSDGEIFIRISNKDTSVKDIIDSAEEIDLNLPYEIYSINGYVNTTKSLNQLPKGIYILRQGLKIKKYINY